MSDKRGYKRLHFFKMFLTEDDWNDRHRYHIEKYELHNRIFHGEGILPYEAEGMLVTQQPRSQLAVDARPATPSTAKAATCCSKRRTSCASTAKILRRILSFMSSPALSLSPACSCASPNRRAHQPLLRRVLHLLHPPPPAPQLRVAAASSSPKTPPPSPTPKSPAIPEVNEIDLRFRRISRVNKAVDGDLRRKAPRHALAAPASTPPTGWQYTAAPHDHVLLLPLRP